MTDRIAFAIAGLLALAALADLIVNDGSALVFLAHKLLDLVSLVSFWR